MLKRFLSLLTLTIAAPPATAQFHGETTFVFVGDGQTSELPTLRKTYPPGEYYLTLTASDPLGLQHEVRDIRLVSGNHRPAADLQLPEDGRRYEEGELISFVGQGVDPLEGLLPWDRLTWLVTAHRGGLSRPVLGPAQGLCEGSFVAESHGGEETFYEIRLTVTDRGEPLGASGTLTGSRSVFIYPGDR